MELKLAFFLQLLALASCINILEVAGIRDAEPESASQQTYKVSQDTLSASITDASSSAADSSKTTSIDSSETYSINPALPAGGVQMLTPNSISTTYIKSGEKVTFGWNYTSLNVSPSAINIDVSCSQNSQVYTLARNQSLKTSSIVWDTNKAVESGGLHLISADYTLRIYDAGSSPSDIASAGKLSAFDYTFSIYIPQKYTPWPQGAKYVNISVRASPPAFLTLVLVAVFSIVSYLI